MFTVDRVIAIASLSYVDPMIKVMLGSSMTKRQDLHILIALRDSFADNGMYYILAEESYGNETKWEHRYDEVARAKTLLSARTGMTSRDVHQVHPELLNELDTQFWGNAIRGNIIVSCSGIQPWFDEAIANATVGICQAMVQDRYERQVNSEAPYCMQCGIQMVKAGAVHACPSCGRTGS